MPENQVPEFSVADPEQTQLPMCGLVMPISGSVNDPLYSHVHWIEVRSIINEAVEKAGFRPSLVSESAASGLIHGRIVQNLGEYPMIVCDVSNKNPNVMFELGLRLAFDKPTIVIKDDLTDFSFDTSPIEHLLYVSSLHILRIREFQDSLTEKIKATYKNFESGNNQGTFLSHFSVSSVKLETKEVSKQDLIIENVTDKISELSEKVGTLSKMLSNSLTLREYLPSNPGSNPSLVSLNTLSVPQIASVMPSSSPYSRPFNPPKAVLPPTASSNPLLDPNYVAGGAAPSNPLFPSKDTK